MNRLLLPLILSLIIAGCGRKGPLLPPEALVPAEVSSLAVQQKGEELQIIWSAPGKEKSGRPLKDLAGFRLQKREVRGDSSDCAACGESWLLLKTVDLDTPDPAGRSNGTFIYRDRVPAGAASQYRLLAYSRSGGVSSPATSKIITMQPALAPPALTLTVLPGSIGASLAFTPPKGGTLKGYNIYRRTPDAPMPVIPYAAAPQSGAWEDKQVSFDRSYLYAATALVAIGGEIVESSPSAEASILFSLQELR
ncbi:MAG: fibronectin type III domain-containing protein [Geobacter sp.]|nr:fibronectin type III domain-containing protein [Geobacter sp.]